MEEDFAPTEAVAAPEPAAPDVAPAQPAAEPQIEGMPLEHLYKLRDQLAAQKAQTEHQRLIDVPDDLSGMSLDELTQRRNALAREKYAPQLQEAHQYAAQRFPDEGTAHFIGRSVAGAIHAPLSEFVYGNSLKALNEDKADQSDLRNIAIYERFQNFDQQRGLPGQLAGGLLRLPGEAAIFAAGGAVGKAAGLLAAAPEGAGLAAKVGTAVMNLPMKTALAPNMYLEPWMQENIKEGRSSIDPAGLPGAFAKGLASMASLEGGGAAAGQLMQGAGVGKAIGRIGIQGATMPVSQAVADAVTGAVGLDEGYGVISDLIDKKYGEAGKKLAHQILTGLAFAIGHEALNKGVPIERIRDALTGREPNVETGAAEVPPGQVGAGGVETSPGTEVGTTQAAEGAGAGETPGAAGPATEGVLPTGQGDLGGGPPTVPEPTRGTEVPATTAVAVNPAEKPPEPKKAGHTYYYRAEPNNFGDTLGERPNKANIPLTDYDNAKLFLEEHGGTGTIFRVEHKINDAEGVMRVPGEFESRGDFKPVARFTEKIQPPAPTPPTQALPSPERVEELRSILKAVGEKADKWVPGKVLKRATELKLDQFKPTEELTNATQEARDAEQPAPVIAESAASGTQSGVQAADEAIRSHEAGDWQSRGIDQRESDRLLNYLAFDDAYFHREGNESELKDFQKLADKAGIPGPMTATGLADKGELTRQAKAEGKTRSAISMRRRRSGEIASDKGEYGERKQLREEKAVQGAINPADEAVINEEEANTQRDLGRPLTEAERRTLPGGGQPNAEELNRAKSVTALANSETDKSRTELGLPPILKQARQSNPAVWDEAMAKLDANPKAGEQLVNELAAKSRSTTVEENALLLQRRVALRNEYKRASIEGIDAFKRKASAIEQNQIMDRADALLKEIGKTDRVIVDTGSEWGKAGQFRRQLAAEDFSLAGMLLRAEAAKGKPLTPEEKIKIEGQQKTIEESEAAADKAEGEYKEKPKETTGIGISEAAKPLQKAKAKAAGDKGDFERVIEELKQSNRPASRKWGDLFLAIQRANLLSGVTTLGKIGTAAAETFAITPAKEAAGAIISRIPVIGEIARTSNFGRGSLAAEGAALKSFGQGIADGYDIITTGKSELKSLYGRSSTPGMESLYGEGKRSILDLPQDIHAAIKAPALRAEYERLFIKGLDSYIAQGKDATSPAALAVIGAKAFKEANRAIFMESNVVADGINRWLENMRSPQRSAGSQIIGAGAKSLIPIVKIGTNVVAQAWEAATGLVSGGVRASMVPLQGGLKNLSPEHADLIMRQLKAGSIGGAAFLIGAFNPKMFGGFYQGKRDEKDVKPGAVRIGGVNIPAWSMHAPVLIAAQLGASFTRTLNTVYHGEHEGVVDAAISSMGGLAKEAPFFEQPAKLADASIRPGERGKVFGQYLAGISIPRLVSWFAQQSDKPTPFNPMQETRKRQPHGVIQTMEQDIPGLRQRVPLK